MERMSKDEYFTKMGQLVSRRATCARRSVGCVLVSSRGHVLATGYNGTPSGSDHCIDSPCPGASYPSGTGLERCEAVHAEQNALLQCRNVFEIETAYVTAMPCMTCIKLLLNTSCKRIIYIEDYPHAEAKDLWIRNGRELLQAPATFSRS
jgi:dCMP deaminase